MAKAITLRTRPARRTAAAQRNPAGTAPSALEAALPAGFEAMAAQYETERVLGWLVHDVHRLLGRAFDARIRDMGLTRPQWRVMMHLIRFEGLTQTELAERLETEKAPLGKLIDKLEERGWCVRRADPSDRRVKRVHATAKIAPLLPELLKVAQGLFAEALKGLSAADRRVLTQSLARMKVNLGGEADEGRF